MNYIALSKWTIQVLVKTERSFEDEMTELHFAGLHPHIYIHVDTNTQKII